MKNIVSGIILASMIGVGGWYMTVMSQKDIVTPLPLAVPTPPALQDVPEVTEESVVQTEQQEPSVTTAEASAQTPVQEVAVQEEQIQVQEPIQETQPMQDVQIS